MKDRPASKSAYLEDDAYAPRVGKWVTLPLQRVSSRIRTQMPREITFRPPHVFVTSDPTRFVAANFLGPNFRTNPSYAILFFFLFFLSLFNQQSLDCISISVVSKGNNNFPSYFPRCTNFKFRFNLTPNMNIRKIDFFPRKERKS